MTRRVRVPVFFHGTREQRGHLGDNQPASASGIFAEPAILGQSRGIGSWGLRGSFVWGHGVRGILGGTFWAVSCRFWNVEIGLFLFVVELMVSSFWELFGVLLVAVLDLGEVNAWETLG